MSKGKDTENKQFYVWTKSERVGQIVELDDTTPPEKGWTLFTDGTKCNSALMFSHTALLGVASKSFSFS